MPPRTVCPPTVRTWAGLSANRYDPESVSNPYGLRTATRIHPHRIDNQFQAPTENRYSPLSPRSPYTTQGAHGSLVVTVAAEAFVERRAKMDLVAPHTPQATIFCRKCETRFGREPPVSDVAGLERMFIKTSLEHGPVESIDRPAPY